MSAGSFEYVGGFHHSQLTPEICVRLVQSNGKLLTRIPKHLRTNEVLVAAVRSAPKVIKDLHPKEITPEMYRVAVDKDQSLVKFIPNACRNWKDYLELWKINDTTFDMLIENTPTEFLPVVYEETHSNNHKLLKFIPEHYRTRIMCERSIKAYLPDVLQLIPKNFLDQEMYNLLVSFNAVKIDQIPDPFITEELALNMVRSDAGVFARLPTRLVTRKFVIKAYQKNYDLIHYINKAYMDRDLFKMQFARTGSLTGIPTEHWSEDMILSHMLYQRSWGRRQLTLEEIPEHLRTELIRTLFECK
jgi:hypothetical protein